MASSPLKPQSKPQQLDNRHRHNPHQFEEKMSKYQCKNTFKKQESNMALQKPSDPIIEIADDSNGAKMQEN